MPALIRDNLPYKLLALVFAVLLHFYVAGQQNPGRLVTVPLTVRNLPPDLLLGPDAPRQLTVTLNGPAGALDHLALADVTAAVDLSHALAGKSYTVPVQVKAPDDLQAGASPDTVTLDLVPKQRRRMTVTASLPGPALPGYRFQTPRVTPGAVTVTGSRDAVAAVARLVVNADAPASRGTVDDDFDIVALDDQGSQVTNVTLTPPRARVVIRMVRAPAAKNVPVSADIVGALPPTFRVDSIQIRPLTVVITGSAARLAQISTISTAPIDVTGLTADVTRPVNCEAPPGVKLSQVSAVVVTVHIVPQGVLPASASGPGPNPAPPPSSGPPGPTTPQSFTPVAPTLNGTPVPPAGR